MRKFFLFGFIALAVVSIIGCHPEPVVPTGTNIPTGGLTPQIARYYDATFKVNTVPSDIQTKIFTQPSAYIEPLVDYLTEGIGDPLAKMKVLHDWLATYITYDYEQLTNSDPNYDTSIEGTLLRGKAVCGGYTVAYKTLCAHAGLNVEYVSGSMRSVLTNTSTGDMRPLGHAWNMVSIDGKYYFIDVTADRTTDHTPIMNRRFLIPVEYCYNLYCPDNFPDSATQPPFEWPFTFEQFQNAIIFDCNVYTTQTFLDLGLSFETTPTYRYVMEGEAIRISLVGDFDDNYYFSVYDVNGHSHKSLGQMRISDHEMELSICPVEPGVYRGFLFRVNGEEYDWIAALGAVCSNIPALTHPTNMEVIGPYPDLVDEFYDGGYVFLSTNRGQVRYLSGTAQYQIEVPTGLGLNAYLYDMSTNQFPGEIMLTRTGNRYTVIANPAQPGQYRINLYSWDGTANTYIGRIFFETVQPGNYPSSAHLEVTAPYPLTFADGLLMNDRFLTTNSGTVRLIDGSVTVQVEIGSGNELSHSLRDEDGNAVYGSSYQSRESNVYSVTAMPVKAGSYYINYYDYDGSESVWIGRTWIDLPSDIDVASDANIEVDGIFPRYYDTFFDSGIELTTTNLGNFTLLNGEAVIRFTAPTNLDMRHYVYDTDWVSVPHSSFLQAQDGEYEWRIQPQEPGNYTLRLYEYVDEEYVRLIDYYLTVNASAGSVPVYPRQHTYFYRYHAWLDTPFQSTLTTGQTYDFDITVPYADIVKVYDGTWYTLTNTGDHRFEGSLTVNPATNYVRVYGKQAGDSLYQSLIEYRVD